MNTALYQTKTAEHRRICKSFRFLITVHGSAEERAGGRQAAIAYNYTVFQ